MAIISNKMSGDILASLNKNNEKVLCFENLNIDKEKWRFILSQLCKKYKVRVDANLNEKEAGWKWTFSNNTLNIDSDNNPLTEPLNIEKIDFAMGKKDMVNDLSTLIKGGTII